MRTYTYETRFRVPAAFYVDYHRKPQKNFAINQVRFRFGGADNEGNGVVYYLSYTVRAAYFGSAVKKIDKHIAALEDALCFYFGMPVVWEWWYYLVRRKDDTKRQMLSLFTQHNVTQMVEHTNPRLKIKLIMDRMETNKNFVSSMTYHASYARLDGMEFSRAHLPILFQLIESVSAKVRVRNTDGTYRHQVSSNDLRTMLGRDLHKKLYSQKGKHNSARNIVMHGGSVDANRLGTLKRTDIEEAIKKVRERLIMTNDLHPGVPIAGGRVDIIRSWHEFRGARLGVEIKPGIRLAKAVQIAQRNGVEAVFSGVQRLPKSW